MRSYFGNGGEKIALNGKGVPFLFIYGRHWCNDCNRIGQSLNCLLVNLDPQQSVRKGSEVNDYIEGS